MQSYELSRIVAEQNYNHWISAEVLTIQWFIMIGVLVSVYSLWLKVLDKTRTKEILLLGSLCAVAYAVLEIILAGGLGFWQYKISLIPVRPSILVVNLSLAPVLHMIAFQYTSSWKGFIIGSTLGMAFLSFVLLPFYSAIEIFQLHNGWNYFYHFLFLLSIGCITRGILLWFESIESGASTNKIYSHMGLQAVASKPVNNDNNEE